MHKSGPTRFQKRVTTLIVSDLGLPDINGIELCRAIRAKGFRIPIIALTANYEGKEACTKAGFDKFLQKPINSDLLKQTVGELLEKE